jgi:hypothetical protein
LAVSEWLNASQKRPEEAICAFQRDGHFPRLTRFSASLPPLDNLRQSSRIMNRLPTLAEHYVRGCAGVAIPFLVIPERATVTGGDPSKVWKVFGKSS